MMRRIAGAGMILMGVGLLGWVGYNLFIERLPATQGRSPVPALVFSAGLLYVGVTWVKGKKPEV